MDVFFITLTFTVNFAAQLYLIRMYGHLFSSVCLCVHTVTMQSELRWAGLILQQIRITEYTFKKIHFPQFLFGLNEL